MVDSLGTCLKQAEGTAIIDILESPKLEVIKGGKDDENSALKVADNGSNYQTEIPKEIIFSENFACP